MGRSIGSIAAMCRDLECYSADYATARRRFRQAAVSAGARLYEIALRARGPDDAPLTIDIAWLGGSAPRRVLLHSSGLHGIEGFAGSAIQLRLLTRPPPLADDRALVLVHCLNPYGMAWLRRANENNVDLNRNFMTTGETWSGAPAGYARLDRTINPASPPARDLFYLRAALAVLRHGFANLQKAVAVGQYQYPRGLFYGGACLEEGPVLYQRWMEAHLAEAQYVLAIDVHTGLGDWGRELLFLEARSGGHDAESLARRLGRDLLSVSHDPAIGYANRGGLGRWLSERLRNAQVDFITQEFGTYPALRVLHALREENRAHYYAPAGRGDAATRRLREVIFPASARWRRSVLGYGESLARRALAVVCADD